ncbi:M56 family metallopeptidase [Christiangramia sp. SM2212]|uniref:M56 family metallopeptidase n=1 Tax=Christiangramia sediminicola TaxID=3073267 RepID=A0ABU1EMK3_9FLAO|nr:M56 family metallopeptidase [Christiangramia sp. SM2212]MDR5589615.1 M56 family metallopeptidase [Christiangramia sp. SM2212]
MESLLIYLIKASALLGIFYLSYIFLLRKETSFQLNRKYLLAGILTSGILPAIYFTKKVYIQASSQDFNFSVDPSLVTTTPVETSIDWWQITGIIYLLVTGFFLLRLLFQLLSVVNILISNRFRKIAGLKYLETSENQLPFSFFNFIIFNPEKHSKKDLHLILDHERVHARQFHSADILIANITSCILWFNPFSWLYKKSIEQNLEFIADRETVKNKSEIKDYQHALIKVSIADLKPALTNHFYQSFIKKRILMLNKKSSTNSPAWKLSLITPLLLAFMLLFNVKSEAMIITAQENNQQTEQNKVPEATEEMKMQIEEEAEVIEEQESFETIEVISDEEPEKVHFIEIENSKRRNPASMIGADPLYVINNKEYKSSRLENKYIALNSRLNFIPASEAMKRYGNKGENGAVIIPDGTIIKNFDKKLKEAQELSNDFSGKFLSVGENGKPSIIEIRSSKNSNEAFVKPYSFGSGNVSGVKYINATSNSFSPKSDFQIMRGTNSRVFTTSPKVKVRAMSPSSENTARIMELKTKSKNNSQAVWIQNDSNKVYVQTQDNSPIYVVDDEIMGKDFIVNSIKPEEIAAINVLKGGMAIREYGKKAENGVIIIKTKASGYKATNKKPEIVVFGIEKNYSDSKLESLKTSILESTGMKVQFSGIQRNSNNEITKIEVSVENDDQKASANWDDTDGIPKISIGFSEKNGIFIKTR